MSDGWGYSRRILPRSATGRSSATETICLSTVAGGRQMTSPVLPWQEWGRQRWRHLAVVADPAHQQVKCYLDGKSVFQGALRRDFSACFGNAQIGNWQPMTGLKERAFCGRMDELVILGPCHDSRRNRGNVPGRRRK